MKGFNVVRSALSVFVAISFAGCSEGAQITPPDPSHQNPAEMAMPGVSGPLHGEVFRTQTVAVKTTCPASLGAMFQASGNATGPYPGKFTESGTWGWFKQGIYLIWHFKATFDVSSGKSAISGTIKSSGLGGFARCHSFLQLWGHALEHLKYRTKHGGQGVVWTREIRKGTLHQTFF